MTRRDRAIAWGLVCAALLACGACSCEEVPQRLPTVNVKMGSRIVSVEVASTDEQRAMGMKFRRELGPDEGMLFVFPRERGLSFYMKDTPSPLSIAFLRADGLILNIAHMEPLSLASRRSRLPCRYALEMPQGWFNRQGVKEGDRVELPERLPQAE